MAKAPDWARSAGLEYVNIPLTTKRPATEEQTVYFLNIVNDPANWPVFVHCKGGRHRTGEMTAIYRITQDGWTGNQAYEEMKKYDFENSFFYPRSLKRYVFSYYIRRIGVPRRRTQNLDLTRQRFEAGVSDNVEVVQSQAALVTAHFDYINSVFAHNLAKLSLARAIGRAAD